LSKVFSIIFIVAAAIVVRETVIAAIERYLQETDDTGSEVTRSQRIRTLLPLFRNIIFVVLAVIVTLTVLSEIGVNIAPLLAGAGVVGLAVGFGAQTLVKDVITGLLFLIEDAIAVGDVVELGSHSGVVEAVTVRSLRLRDMSGTVHQIPFSEVSSIVNKTKDFSFAVMDIGVAYRENVDAVIEVIKQVGAELREDPEINPFILEDIDVLGLDWFDDSAVVIRARIKTQPIKQWTVRRAFNRLLKQKFDELGIEIPFPHQTIFFGVDKEGRAPAAPIRLGPQQE
jgi:small-conductance mechanosensitive channel